MLYRELDANLKQIIEDCRFSFFSTPQNLPKSVLLFQSPKYMFPKVGKNALWEIRSPHAGFPKSLRELAYIHIVDGYGYINNMFITLNGTLFFFSLGI